MPSSFSSRLIPRDRQMMIKKAPLRVRTTPRRSTPLPDTPLSTMLPVPQPPDPRAFFPIFLRSLRSACASFSGLSFSSDLFAIFSFIGPESWPERLQGEWSREGFGVRVVLHRPSGWMVHLWLFYDGYIRWSCVKVKTKFYYSVLVYVTRWMQINN